MKVLVPIDFEEVSINAIKYAVELFPEAEITIVHVIGGLLDPNDPMVIKPAVGRDVSVKKDLEAMLIKHLPDLDHKSLDIQVLIGEVVRSITRYHREEGMDAIVMGTRDKYDVFDRWIGTSSLGVIKSVDIPVYLIPRQAEFRGFAKVVIASDHHISNSNVLEFIQHWNLQNASLTFAHIRQGWHDDFNHEEQGILHTLFKEEDPGFAFEVKVIDGSDVTNSLLSLADLENADLLISIPAKQNFFQALFFRSNTKALIESANVPMLFLSAEAAKKSNELRIRKQIQNNES